LNRIIGKEAEEPARKRFEKYLREDQGIVDLSWRCSEAPDRFLHCGINTYAVEITTLIESIPIGELRAHPLPMSEIVHNKIARKFENVAKEKSILHGTYSLAFGRSLLNKHELEKITISFVLDYIERTMMDEKAPMETLPSSNSVISVASIVKHSSDGAKLSDAHHPVSAREGDCRSEAQRIITDRVESKIEKLTACEFPIVLLLWDATILISYRQLREIEIPRSWQESIAAAYLVRQDCRVFQFWSSIRDWGG